jgi:hypothetical protein
MRRASLSLIAALFLLPFAAWASTEQPDWIPDNLRVPPGNELLLRGWAVGVQIYECQASETGFQWILLAPEAALFRGNAELVATHFGGPTWQARDGSRVVGTRVDGADAPNPSSVPWLLLRAVSHEGTGFFSNVTYVQRLLTGGGIAPPAGTCDEWRQGEQSRVEYDAVYYFYVESPKKRE